jgi:hypothetical protein
MRGFQWLESMHGKRKSQYSKAKGWNIGMISARCFFRQRKKQKKYNYFSLMEWLVWVRQSSFVLELCYLEHGPSKVPSRAGER